MIKRYPHFSEATFHVKQRDILSVLMFIDLYVSRETISCPHLFHVEQKPLIWAGFRLFFRGFWAILNCFTRFVS